MVKEKVKKIVGTTKTKSKNILEIKPKKQKEAGEISVNPTKIEPVAIEKALEPEIIVTPGGGMLETRYFKLDTIKQKLEEVLLTLESVEKINFLNIEGSGDRLVTTITLEINNGLKMKGTMILELENKGEFVDIDPDLKIRAGFIDKFLMNMLLKPELGGFSQKLKEYLEDQKLEDGQNYEVTKIQIKNGQLEVVFKK